MTALPPSFAHPSISLPDIGGVTPLSEEEISALSYAAWRQHLDEVAGVFELERAEQARKAAEAQQAQDRLEGKALTRVLNRLGFPIADLPSNEFIAPDGVRFSLATWPNESGSVTASSFAAVQPIASQEADHFYLRVAFSHDPQTGEDTDIVYASRIFGDNRRMTAEQITDIQAALPAAIAAVKAEVQAEVEARARRIAAAAADKPAIAAGPAFAPQVTTIDQIWEQGNDDSRIDADMVVEERLIEGWSPLNITVALDAVFIHRVVTLARQVPVEAVQ